MLGQQGGQQQGTGQGEGNMRLRPSSEIHPVLKTNAAYLLSMYEKAYNAYLSEQAQVQSLRTQYQTANSRVAALNAEKQAIYAERSQYKLASEKWEALHVGLDMEHQRLKKDASTLRTQLDKANKSLTQREKDLLEAKKQIASLKQKNLKATQEIQRLEEGTPALIEAALKARKQPTLYERMRSIPGKVMNFGSPATQAGASAAWLIAGLYVIGRIE